MPLMRTVWRWTAAIFLAVCLASATKADVQSERAALDDKFAVQLEKLAAWCDERGQPAIGKWTREWRLKREPDTLFVPVVPDALHEPPQIAGNTDLAEWWKRLIEIREARADELYALVGKALAEHKLPNAYELAREALRENPEHKKARELLGYELVAGHWVTPYAAKRLAKGEIDHPKYGWIAAADLPRFEKGERRFHDVWRSADDDAKAHAAAKAPWRVESEHYIVSSTHSLEAGVRLCRELERLEDAWRTVFVGFYMSEGEFTKRYQGIALPRHELKQHLVMYYRNRDEYVAALKTMQPLIDKTIGYYRPENQTAYFFASDDADFGAVYHEATHQLFLESRPTQRDPGRNANFWAIEGIACYMESLAEHSDTITLGGPDAGRMPAARKRLLDDGFYVPLAEMCATSRDALQHDARLPRIYSQSAGLATFFMHDSGGHYRNAFIDYLLDIYTGKADSGALTRRCGESFTRLDEQYREFMKEAGGGGAGG